MDKLDLMINMHLSFQLVNNKLEKEMFEVKGVMITLTGKIKILGVWEKICILILVI